MSSAQAHICHCGTLISHYRLSMILYTSLIIQHELGDSEFQGQISSPSECNLDDLLITTVVAIPRNGSPALLYKLIWDVTTS